MAHRESESYFLSRHFRRTQRLATWLNDPTFRLLKRIEADLLKRLESGGQTAIDHNWLVRHRANLRRIIPHGRVGAIRLYLRNCPAEMEPLCVWLVGQCADRFRLYGLAGRWDDPSPQIRRHVAKAFRRAEAWALLSKMARAFPEDARIQWFAKTPTGRRPFADRLKNYTRVVDDSHAGEVATPSQMPYWAVDERWEYSPPKSRDLIRRMLRRIRHWVRWRVS